MFRPTQKAVTNLEMHVTILQALQRTLGLATKGGDDLNRKYVFDQRTELGDGELVDIGFRSLQENPIGTLRTIYENLGIEGFDTASPLFDSYIESQRDYQKNHLPLAANEKEAVARSWKDVFDRLGYRI